MNPTYTGAEFFKALSESALKPPLAALGFAKPAKDVSQAILLSQDPTCSGGTLVPVAVIERIEHITTVRCCSHEQPYVCVYLKEPCDNPLAEMFAGLLRQLSIQPQPFPPGLAIPAIAGKQPRVVFIQPQPLPPG